MVLVTFQLGIEMRIRFFAALVAALAVFTATADVQAALVTSNGDVMVEDPTGTMVPGGNPPLQLTHLFLQGGQLFTNQVNGAPFQVGSTIRTVGAAPVTNGRFGGSLAPPLVDPNTGEDMAVIFAVEGTITSLTFDQGGNFTGAVATFTTGSLFFTTAGVNFNLEDPLSWNFGDSFARYDLVAPTEVINGATVGIAPAGNFSQDAANLNQSQALVNQQQGDGSFVFHETAFGDDFIDNIQLPGGGTTDDAYLVGSTSQVVQSAPVVLNPAQIAALDAIGNEAGFGGNFSEGGFTPTPSGVGSGDFTAELNTSLYIAAVPEPSSLAIFGLLCGGAAVRFTKRRFAKKA